MGAFVTTMVPREPMNVPKSMPNVISCWVLTFSVTKKQISVQISVQMKLPTVSEHHPDIVAAAAPRHAAEPRPSEYTSPSWFRHRYCIWIPPTGRAIPLIKTYKRLSSIPQRYAFFPAPSTYSATKTAKNVDEMGENGSPATKMAQNVDGRGKMRILVP